jgi:hypothetical protein
MVWSHTIKTSKSPRDFLHKVGNVGNAGFRNAVGRWAYNQASGGIRGSFASGAARSIFNLFGMAEAVGTVAAKLGMLTARLLSNPKGSRILGNTTTALLSTSLSGEKDSGTPQELFKRRTQEIRALATDPSTKLKLNEALAGLREENFVIGDYLEDQIRRAAEFLYSVWPKDPGTMQDIDGSSRWRPADYELTRAARYYGATLDPVSVFEQVVSGGITPESAEALRVVHPEIYAGIQVQLAENRAKLGALDASTKRRLSVLLDTPLEPSVDPHTQQFFIDFYAQESQSQGKQRVQFKPGKTLASNELTAAQRNQQS